MLLTLVECLDMWHIILNGSLDLNTHHILFKESLWVSFGVGFPYRQWEHSSFAQRMSSVTGKTATHINIIWRHYISDNCFLVWEWYSKINDQEFRNHIILLSLVIPWTYHFEISNSLFLFTVILCSTPPGCNTILREKMYLLNNNNLLLLLLYSLIKEPK